MALAPQNIDPNHLVLYNYTPSDVAAYAFMVVFGIGTIVHLFYLFRLRQCFFIPLIIGGIMETGGYYGRAWGHNEPTNFKAYILQALLLMPAPIFIAATMYMTLGRIIAALESDKKHSLIRPRWLSKLFVFGDIICFIVQIVGIGMQCTTSASTRRLGRRVVIVGLILQILMFIYFVIVAMVFHRRLNKRPTAISRDNDIHWARDLRVMYISSILMLVRNTERVAEYAEGSNGPISHSEAYLYVFDATLMALVIWALAIIHPGRLLRVIRRLKKIQLTRTEEEVKVRSQLLGTQEEEILPEAK